ncbi:Succinate dehydrogenase assembly factor 3 (SDH assembly factor 3) (SDHAF3) [Mucor velutinosus]|uniref:Succinate dehydrogenase assembly factor 3 (SDH assembly factor 3) (SDHAF3) n=1 Tax=Mucor velutinosus TaxID=708070 RepID=A0AAN7DRX9_9FUNG|nr:Succinate dehydrogenase assembly factor 3 (SDH assembly factor 3) (SDHAF3) [Mucor velutinosus]
MEFQGFPRIHSIFYAVFDIIKGTVVKHQVPEGSITPQNGPASVSDSITIDPSTHHNSSKTLINFEAISEYIIPKKQLYKRLVTICTNGYKVMGCPVVLHDHERYQHFRNEFRFNLCFVFEQNAETSSYEAVVRKLSRVLEGLELECNFLSEEVGSESQTVQNVIEQLFEDLNSYCECQIPINEFNTINLKLFPTYPNPQTVYNYHVPVCTVDVNKIMTSNWDITVQKVASLINGVNHVKRIAELANVKPEWARQSMEHMMYYGCIIMTDIFQYSNVYAVKPEITRLFDAKYGLAQECLRYIMLPNAPEISIERVYALYCGLKYGLTVKDWIEEQQLTLLHIDERRVISFGVIKGLIYRVHKYPILTSTSQQENEPFRFPSKQQYHRVVNKYTGMSIHSDIIPFLDGKHHYDEICTELECSPQELDEQLGCTQQMEDSNATTMNGNTDNIVETLYEGMAEDKQNEDGLSQWSVEFIFR